jgi:hypothetical protein
MLFLQAEAQKNNNAEDLKRLSDCNIGHIVYELFGGGKRFVVIFFNILQYYKRFGYSNDLPIEMQFVQTASVNQNNGNK